MLTGSLIGEPSPRTEQKQTLPANLAAGDAFRKLPEIIGVIIGVGEAGYRR
jgi:hypothetical protein